MVYRHHIHHDQIYLHHITLKHGAGIKHDCTKITKHSRRHPITKRMGVILLQYINYVFLKQLLFLIYLLLSRKCYLTLFV